MPPCFTPCSIHHPNTHTDTQIWLMDTQKLSRRCTLPYPPVFSLFLRLYTILQSHFNIIMSRVKIHSDVLITCDDEHDISWCRAIIDVMLDTMTNTGYRMQQYLSLFIFDCQEKFPSWDHRDPRIQVLPRVWGKFHLFGLCLFSFGLIYKIWWWK